VVEKASITFDGISLTVTDVRDNGASTRIGVALIPHTLAVTTFGVRDIGQSVNVEVDLMAKYIERLWNHDAMEA
jgi:riboflavin synthase